MIGTQSRPSTLPPTMPTRPPIAQNQPDFNSVDCPIDCDAVIGTPSRPSTQPPTEPGGSTRPPTADKDSDGALGLTTTLAATAVAFAAAF